MGRLFDRNVLIDIGGRMQREHFVRRLAAAMGCDAEGVAEDTVLTENNWDSMVVLTAIGIIDEDFGVRVNARELEAASSVRDVCALVEQAVGEGNSRSGP